MPGDGWLCHHYSESVLGWTGDVEDAKRTIVTLVPRIKDSLRAGRPVLLWYAFADTAYEVVTGFDSTAPRTAPPAAS